jgi:hypothetical protein
MYKILDSYRPAADDMVRRSYGVTTLQVLDGFYYQLDPIINWILLSIR